METLFGFLVSGRLEEKDTVPVQVHFGNSDQVLVGEVDFEIFVNQSHILEHA